MAVANNIFGSKPGGDSQNNKKERKETNVVRVQTGTILPYALVRSAKLGFKYFVTGIVTFVIGVRWITLVGKGMNATHIDLK